MPSSLEVRRLMLNEILPSVFPTDLGRVDNAGIGRVFYVNNAASNASDSNRGDSWASPFSTIGAAMALCVANRGDKVYVGPGHAETIATASAINFSIAGVEVIGVGRGSKRPTLTWATLTTATITMASANCRLSGFYLNMALPSALVSGIVGSAAGCSIDNNKILIGTAGTGTAPTQAILTTAGANDLVITKNKIIGPSATPTTVSAGTSAICLVGGDGIEITDNYIHGWFTTSSGCILGLTTLTSNLLIRNNDLCNQTASSTKAIVLLTGSTGIIDNNRMGILSGTAPITGDATFVGGNYYAAAKGVTAGTLL